MHILFRHMIRIKYCKYFRMVVLKTYARLSFWQRELYKIKYMSLHNYLCTST